MSAKMDWVLFRGALSPIRVFAPLEAMGQSTSRTYVCGALDQGLQTAITGIIFSILSLMILSHAAVLTCYKSRRMNTGSPLIYFPLGFWIECDELAVFGLAGGCSVASVVKGCTVC